ncbi:MAG: hypothetical protein U9O94_08365 [Nanoarchaeota archaeon]|nr:hypothetical protein [Nanoarchaeota archaeon]
MEYDEKQEVEDKLESNEQKQKSISTVNPFVYVAMICFIGYLVAFGNLSTQTWVIISIVILVVWLLMKKTSRPFFDGLTTEEAWVRLDQYIHWLKKNKHIQHYMEYTPRFLHVLPFHEDRQTFYYLPFFLRDVRNNSSQECMAQIDRYTGNVSHLIEYSKGFTGNEKPNTKYLIPPQFAELRKNDLDKYVDGGHR